MGDRLYGDLTIRAKTGRALELIASCYGHELDEWFAVDVIERGGPDDDITLVRSDANFGEMPDCTWLLNSLGVEYTQRWDNGPDFTEGAESTRYNDDGHYVKRRGEFNETNMRPDDVINILRYDGQDALIAAAQNRLQSAPDTDDLPRVLPEAERRIVQLAETTRWITAAHEVAAEAEGLPTRYNRVNKGRSAIGDDAGACRDIARRAVSLFNLEKTEILPRRVTVDTGEPEVTLEFSPARLAEAIALRMAAERWADQPAEAARQARSIIKHSDKAAGGEKRQPIGLAQAYMALATNVADTDKDMPSVRAVWQEVVASAVASDAQYLGEATGIQGLQTTSPAIREARLFAHHVALGEGIGASGKAPHWFFTGLCEGAAQRDAALAGYLEIMYLHTHKSYITMWDTKPDNSMSSERGKAVLDMLYRKTCGEEIKSGIPLVEGHGDKKKGYRLVAQTLADACGTITSLDVENTGRLLETISALCQTKYRFVKPEWFAEALPRPMTKRLAVAPEHVGVLEEIRAILPEGHNDRKALADLVVAAQMPAFEAETQADASMPVTL